MRMHRAVRLPTVASVMVTLLTPLAVLTACASSTAGSTSEPPGCHPYADLIGWNAARTTEVIYPQGNEGVRRHQVVSLTVGQNWLLEVRGGCRAALDPTLSGDTGVLREIMRAPGPTNPSGETYRPHVAVLYNAVKAGRVSVQFQDVCYVPPGDSGGCTSDIQSDDLEVTVTDYAGTASP
jgi:hypothetical protein